MGREHSRRAGTRSQSATEYLMTYGWAILIIAIVTGAFYSMGAFSTALSGPSACIAITGYLCNDPVLYSSGALKVGFGQVGSGPITVTGSACTRNSTITSINPTPSTLVEPGESGYITFVCPLADSAVGSHFSGYLWIEYSDNNQQNAIAEIGRITATVQNKSAVTSWYYVPVTIYNGNDVATGSDFQEMLTVDSAAYSQYINRDWRNVEFTTGPDGTGTALSAWVESNPSNTATATTVWVYLPDGIAAQSNTVVYMDFTTSNVMSASGPTGEAPQLSCNNPSDTASGCAAGQYAEYDNGASVFSFYDNFAGVSDSNWAYTDGTGSSDPVSVDNGVTISPGAANGALEFYTTSNLDGIWGMVAFDLYAKPGAHTTSSNGNGYTEIGGFEYNGAFLYGLYASSGSSYYSVSEYEGDGQVLTDYPTGLGTPDPALGVYSILRGPNLDGWYTQTFTTLNYADTYNAYFVDPLGAANGPFEIIVGTTVAPTFMQWFRMRVAPPNGDMPTASYGGVVSVI